MAKKKKASKLQRSGAVCIPQNDDTGPKSSPYESTVITLYFRHRRLLHVPNDLLERCPALIAQGSRGSYYRDELHLGYLSLDVGHVLVHFLYTETYQCLRQKGATPGEKFASEFAVALQVYSEAEKYTLPALGELSKVEIRRLGDELSLSTIIDIIEEDNCKSIRSRWVANYFESRVQSFCNSLTRTTADKLLSELDALPPTTSRLILRSVTTLRSRELSSEDSRGDDHQTAGQLELVRSKQTNEAEAEDAEPPVQPTTSPATMDTPPSSEESFVFPKLDVFVWPNDEFSDAQVRRAVVPRPNDDSEPAKKSKKERRQEKKKEKQVRMLEAVEEQLEVASGHLGDSEDGLSMMMMSPIDDSFDWWW